MNNDELTDGRLREAFDWFRSAQANLDTIETQVEDFRDRLEQAGLALDSACELLIEMGVVDRDY